MSKILIVEDNAESRYLLEQLLTSKGHHIVAAENGEDALRLARQDPPEVIISDIMMPVMNGFRLCREVKKDAGLRNIPFIFYTATFVDKADEKLAMSLGASRFIVKPTEGEEFLQILDEVLDEHRQGVLPVPERPLEGEDTLLEMYDNSIARKLAETVEELQDERRALIKSEQRLKEAQEIAQIGHWEFDLKSNSLECSDEIYRILGLKPQEFDASYEAFMAFVHPDDRASVTKARKESLEKKTSYDIECRALLKDGTIKYVNERFQTLYDDEGMPTCSMGTVQDITERKQAEEKLHHLNLVLRAIREVNQLIVKERDRDALIHKTCEILIKTRGYYNVWIALMDEEGTYITSAEAGLGKDFAPMKKLLKEGQWPACAKKALSKKELVITEEPKTECMDCPLSAKYAGRGAYTICLAHNGRNYGILSVSVPELSIGDKQEHGLIREAAGDIGFALHSIEVEKDRKKAEERVRFLSSAVEQSSEGMAIAYMEGNLMHVNQAWAEMHGYEWPEDLVGQHLSIFHTPEQLKNEVEPFNEIVMEKGYHKGEVGHIRKDGTLFPTLMTTTLLKDESGKPIALSAIAKDITDIKRAEAELKIERDTLQGLMDGLATTGIGVDVVGVDYRILHQNKTLKEAFGDLTGKLCYENYMGLDIPCDPCPMAVAIKNGKVEKAEMTGSDGRHYEILSAPLPSVDGVVDKAIEVVLDITERKRAEEKLRDSEERYRVLFENSADFVYTTDLKANFTNVNPAAEHLTGYTKDELIGMNFRHYTPVDDQKRVFQAFSRVFTSGASIKDFPLQVIIKDGSIKYFETYVTPLMKGEEVIGFQGASRDLTERKETEEKIKEYSKNLESMVEERTKALNRALYDTEQARDRIDGILKSVGDGLIVTDLYNRVILMNRAAEDLLGVRLSEVIDRPIDFAIEDKTLRDKIKTTLDKKETGYQFDFELPGYNSAHPRIIRARTSIIEDKSGTQTGIITTIHDVTYEREVDRMKTEFISTAAHELRTPLTSILGFSEVLLNQDTLPAEEKKEFLGYINTQSKALSKIIDDLLDISRIESGQGFSMSKEPCDPFRITRKVISYYEKLSPTHRFEVMFPKRPIRIMADRDKLEQVVKNLIDNAVKYSPDGGAIRIRGKRVGDQYQISVEDQGIGMTPEQVERMFDKFYRAKDASFISKGTGLGMSIVKHIVEFHGGKVWVESEHGKGTTVSFTVPVGEENGK
jgi:PAS domain S-box-containing protein